MFNRSALSQNLPPAIAPTISSRMATAIHSPLADDLPLVRRVGWQRLFGLFRLPTTLRGYMAFLASLLVLAFTMTLHIMLSAEIMRLDVQLADLRDQHARTERYNANIVWEISQHGALDSLHEQAQAAGYVNNVPTTYVDMPLAYNTGVDRVGTGTALPQDALAVSGANDPTIVDPAAPQPVYQVILGEPAMKDAVDAGGAAPDFSATALGVAPRIGGLANQEIAGTETESWWRRTMPEWLRFNHVGDAIDESLDWIRAQIPSPEWLQQRW